MVRVVYTIQATQEGDFEVVRLSEIESCFPLKQGVNSTAVVAGKKGSASGR